VHLTLLKFLIEYSREYVAENKELECRC